MALQLGQLGRILLLQEQLTFLEDAVCARQSSPNTIVTMDGQASQSNQSCMLFKSPLSSTKKKVDRRDDNYHGPFAEEICFLLESTH